MSEVKKAVKTVSFITFALLLAKFMGLARDMMFAKYYGTDAQAEAFIIASRLPLLFFDLTLGAAVLSTFIPVFNEYIQKDGKDRAFRFSNVFLNFVLALSFFLCIVGMVLATPLVRYVFAPGMTPEGQVLASRLLVIMLPTTVFTACAYVFVGILQSLDEFNIPAVISLVSNLAVILYLLVFNRYGIYGMAFAVLIGWGLQVLVQVPSLIKKKYRYRFVLDYKDEGLRRALKNALPILVSSWVQPICVTINLRFASFLGEGVMAGLDYANKLYIMLVGVFSFALTNYIFPNLSRLSSAGDADEFAKVLKQSLKVIMCIIAPIMVGMALFAQPIISIIYQRGEFDAQSVALTATALLYYSGGMMGLGICEVLNKAFYARKEVRFPMIASLCGIAVNALVAYVLVRYTGLGVGAPALAATIASNVIAVILIVKIRGIFRNIFDGGFLFYVFKIILATLVMACASKIGYGAAARFGEFAALCAAVACGAATYGVMVCLLKLHKEVIVVDS